MDISELDVEFLYGVGPMAAAKLLTEKELRTYFLCCLSTANYIHMECISSY